MERVMTAAAHETFRQHLAAEELAESTIQKYSRDLLAFGTWAGAREITKELSVAWKEHLVQQGYAPATVNSMLAVINHFFKFMGWQDCTVKFLKLQRRLFRARERDISDAEFRRLVEQAQISGKPRLALLLETIAATGIRVSEVKYITVEAAECGRTEISLKGKIRTILLPSKLCRKLLKYAKKQKTAFGEIFLTKSGKSLNRKQIWACKCQ